jgi:hypothetical protein
MWARKASEKLRPLAGRQRRAERNRSFEFVRCETGEEFRLCTRVPFPRKRRKQSLSVCLLRRVASALELHIGCHSRAMHTTILVRLAYDATAAPSESAASSCSPVRSRVVRTSYAEASYAQRFRANFKIAAGVRYENRVVKTTYVPI